MNVRKLALEAIEKVINNKAYSNIVINEFLTKFEFSEQDRKLFTNLVYGTIQYMLTLEYYLEPFLNNKKQKSWVKHLLCMSAYQILYLNIPEYAVLNEAVDIANLKDRHIGSFVNAVLRNLLRNELRSFDGLDDIDRLSIVYSHPSWLVAYLLKDYPSDVVEKILYQNTLVRDDAIRVNTIKATNEDIEEIFKNDNIQFIKSNAVKNGYFIKEALNKKSTFLKGLVTYQDISSQMVAEVIAPKANDVIIDLCSAPGGKAAHMAALMENQGMIFACDKYSHKIKLMENSFRRLGVNIVKTQIIDSRNVKDHVKADSFDHVLADVPCSGLGVVGHKVDLKYHISLDAIEEIICLQKEILEATYMLVKKGGHYTYSTCTINKEENEKQIAQFIADHCEFEIVYEKTILPFEYNSDGFYICKLRRN